MNVSETVCQFVRGIKMHAAMETKKDRTVVVSGCPASTCFF